jgi:hypothetical protein
MTTNTDAPRPTDDATPMPCPFCGDVPKEAWHSSGAWMISCENCSHVEVSGCSPGVAMIEWNTRAPDATLAAVTAERDRYKAIVDQLPKTADGVPITPGMLLWPPCGHVPLMHMPVHTDPVECYGKGCKGEPYYGDNDYYEPGEATIYKPEKCYSTREAALAANGNGSPAMAEILAAFETGTDAEGGM